MASSAFVERSQILLPDRQSAELAAAARRANPAAVNDLPLEFIDDTLSFHPEWVVDKIAPRPILFITTDDDRLVPPEESEALFAKAGEPKKAGDLARLRTLRGLHRASLWSGHGGNHRLVRQVPAAPLRRRHGHGHKAHARKGPSARSSNAGSSHLA
jgi:hypothetical protein